MEIGWFTVIQANKFYFNPEREGGREGEGEGERELIEHFYVINQVLRKESFGLYKVKINQH